jgi:hypothetical protein
MYIRDWKDTEMSTTSASSTSESASDEGQERASAARPFPPNPRATGPRASAASASTPSPQTSAPTDQAPDSARTSEPEDPTPNRAPSKRGGPTVTRSQVRSAVNGVRERVGAIVWIVTVVAAVILAAGALLIALDANPNNDLVDRVVTWAGDLDGPFNNIFTFDGDNAATKAALVNWGLAAIAWLVGGKIVSSIIRP